MLKILMISLTVLTLAGCAKKVAEVRVAKSDAVAEIQSRSRSEPIFYNGKTYQFNLDPAGEGKFALQVSPMAASQQKDAVALATSSLGYYACPSGSAGKLVDKPTFGGKTWKMTAVC